ncbi:MAG: RNA ligase [Pseudomonadota bacterium]
MRHLILTRGAPGAGKSTFLAEHGLTPFTVTPDYIRLSFGGLAMEKDGRITISHAHEKQVWARVEETLNFKMGLGQLIVLDATHQRGRDFGMATKLADRHRYQVHCLDFTNVPRDLTHERNRARADWKVVPDQVIETAYERFASHKIPKGIQVWDPDTFTLEQLEPPMVDLSTYKSVMHVGDLQGCFAPVEELLPNGLNPEVFYIFIGDLLDRGIQNGEVIRWAMEHIAGAENAQLIYGNHEYHIHRFSKGMDPVSREFHYNTLPQIEAVGFTPRDANRLLNEAVDAMRYIYRSQKVLVTHAGIACVPKSLVSLPSQTFWKGTGTYDDPVDVTFSKNADGWFQVHGHRNSKKLPVEAAPGSFNLEAEVEFGGHLRVMTLTGHAHGFDVTTQEIKNDVYRKHKDGRGDQLRPEDLKTEGKLSTNTLEKLENHPLVRAKSFTSKPHIRSLNFTSKAFFDRKWDDVNIMARGLFVGDDRRIVARSYPKFFNLEERAETQMRNLRRSLAFPVKTWVKENGYLGILGWDHLAEEAGLLFASKSTPEGDFAKWFKQIFESDAGENGVKRAGDIVRNRNLTLVFEVNDPERDPHMIAYDRPHVVLLDAIFRTEEFKKVDHADLSQIAATIGVAVKEPGPTLPDWDQFEGWMKSVHAQGKYFQWRGKDLEGFVVEDANGFMFKIKLDFYSFWKSMRGHRDRVRKARENGTEAPLPRIDDQEARDFHDWLITQPTEALSDSIIDLRERFLAA